MDIGDVGFDVLLGVAVRAEVDSRGVYEHLSRRARNFVAKERFAFLAEEEKKHEEFLRKLFKRLYPDCEMRIPEDLRVPLPAVVYDDSTPVTDIIEQAMKAERGARDFYLSMARMAEAEGNTELSVWLNYLANMEKSHYFVLEGELEMARNFNEFDTYWEMMHAGP